MDDATKYRVKQARLAYLKKEIDKPTYEQILKKLGVT